MRDHIKAANEAYKRTGSSRHLVFFENYRAPSVIDRDTSFANPCFLYNTLTWFDLDELRKMDDASIKLAERLERILAEGVK